MMKRRGFTLVELLIGMILVVLLLSAIAMIFAYSTEAVNIGEARIDVYTQARFAVDRLQTDLLGCLNFNDGRQAFILENGYLSSGAIVYPPPATVTNWQNNVGLAADRMSFRATTSVNDSTWQAKVTYQLKAYGDTSRVRGHRSGRPIFVLTRSLRVTEYNAGTGQFEDRDLEDEEVAHFVTSFNIEYYSAEGKYAQLEPTPCGINDPLGDADAGGGGKKNDTTEAIRIPKLRITLQIVDDSGERQERTIVRDLWIPTGS